jgi:hypothetical protein
MNGRTYVVHEAGQRQFGRSSAAADGFLSLDQQDGAAGLSDGNRGSQTIGSAANHNYVVFLAGEGHECPAKRSQNAFAFTGCAQSIIS